jgi:hypothetical protein
LKNYIVVGAFATFLLAVGLIGGSNGFFLDLVFSVVTACLASYLLSVPRRLLKENGILCSGMKEMLEVQIERAESSVIEDSGKP